MWSEAFNYLLVNIMCFSLMCVMWTKLEVIGTESEVKLFRYLCFVFMAYLLEDCLWAFGYFGLIHFPQSVTKVISGIGMLCVVTVTYFWFLYAETKFRSVVVQRPLLRVCTVIPVCIVLILHVLNWVPGFLYYVDEIGTLRHGSAYIVQFLLVQPYNFVVMIQAFTRMRNATTRAKRMEYMIMFTYIIYPITASVIDAFIPMTAVAACGVFFAIFLVFENLQSSRVYIDTLTDLNNRRRADEYIDYVVHNAEEEPFYLLMLDIDKFKSINDTYGHLEGDHAIRIVADTLRKVSANYNCFIARWGGDEFVIVVFAKNISSISQFVTELKVRIINEACFYELPYSISCSVGFSEGKAGISVQKLIGEADEMMYQDKQQGKQKELSTE